MNSVRSCRDWEADTPPSRSPHSPSPKALPSNLMAICAERAHFISPLNKPVTKNATSQTWGHITINNRNKAEKMDRVYLREAAERRWATRFILKAEREKERRGGAEIMESNAGAPGLVSSTSGGGEN